ncbi:MAG: dethiobiotin synthase [Natronospirillum sp.]
MMQRYFVTGTDTDVGKTYVTTRLLEAGAAMGLQVQGLKPVAAGATDLEGGHWINEDAMALLGASNTGLSLPELNPIALPLAASPHLAATEAGVTLTVKDILERLQPALSRPADVTLIEGAGGWLVPINAQETMADLAVALGYPVILVVGMRLGCLNHALLTAQAIRLSGLPCVGWVANVMAHPMAQLAENITSIEQRLEAPCLGTVRSNGDHLDLVDGLQRHLVV